MKLDASLHQTLSRLHFALLHGEEDALIEALKSADLQRLLSQETIGTVRALGKTPLVLLLCTLAAHNDVEPMKAAHWLACYQSITRKSLEPSLATLSPQNVLRVTVQALSGQGDLPTCKNRLKGSAGAWQEAVELCVDHRRWQLALELLDRLEQGDSELDTWRLISRSLSVRHKIFVPDNGQRQTNTDYQVLAQLYTKCAAVASQARLTAMQKALQQLAASALETAGDHSQALACLTRIDPEGKALAIQVDIARNHCKVGDLAKSIDTMDRVLTVLASQPELDEDTRSQLLGLDAANRQESEAFDIQSASNALADLARMANAQDTPVFLVSGTLLGLAREGRLLGHDKDIDVGIVGWDGQYSLCTALQESGLFTVSSQFLKGSETFCIPIQHNATGTWIDIFVYHPTNGRWVTGVDFFFGHQQTFVFTPFELQDIDFLGVTMKAPVNMDLNLRENYGNWRIPDPDYLTHLESPSTRDAGNLPFMLTARLAALSACLKHQPRRLQKALACMKAHEQREGAMPAQLHDLLQERFGARVTEPTLEVAHA